MAPNGPDRVIRFLVRNTLLVLFLVGCVTVYNFPYDTGAPPSIDDSASYYEGVYTPTDTGEDHTYVLVAQGSGHTSGIADDVSAFMQKYDLAQAATLEGGAGSRTLQDITANDTGLDIAESAARFLRLASSLVASPTQLRYKAMTPNYKTYAVPDADAVNSIDCYEAALWFQTRGDSILEQNSPLAELQTDCSGPVLVQVIN